MTSTSAGLGILGGTFDPVHRGHLQAALRVREALGLAEVHLIPAAMPPHRAKPLASDIDRLAMVQAAVAGICGLVADGRELARPGPSYTYDTLRELRAEFPARPLYLIVGADAFRGFDTWHRWRELVDFAHVVVVDRPGAGPPTVSATLSTWLRQRPAMKMKRDAPAGGVHFLSLPPVDISASDIRERLARGAPVGDLLPAAVLAYIHSHHLYQRRADGNAKT